MPKPTRKKLSRGSKLTKDHIFDPMVEVASDMNAAIYQDQMKDGWGTFRMSWHCTALYADYFHTSAVGSTNFGGALGFPFVLPALQSEFNTSGTPSSTDTPIVLEEITLSFDQRGESVLIADSKTPQEGQMSRDAADQAALLEAKLKVALLEKATQCWDSSAPKLAEKEVVSFDFPLSAAFNDDFKLQPFSTSGLEIPMSNYRTYVLSIQGGETLRDDSVKNIPSAASPHDVCLPSFLVTLKFRSKIVSRDAAAAAATQTQNLPTKHLAAPQTGGAPTITSPAGNTTISADVAAGVQTNMTKLDERLVKQLRGGYNEWSDVFPHEELRQDSCYEVIVVPMWHTTSPRVAKNYNSDKLPYIGGSPHQGATCDRRIIPLKYPVTVQHVVAVSNWAGPLTSTGGNPYRPPARVGFVTTVGVGIGVGMRADDYAYQQVALGSWTALDASKAAFRIDTVQLSPVYNYVHTYNGVAQELMEIPLVHSNNANKGKSYMTSAGTATGLPVFAGKALTGLNSRTNVSVDTSTGAFTTSRIAGQDQFLEVRWEFKNAVDGLNGGAVHADTIYIGSPGHWVYIFCKKHLA